MRRVLGVALGVLVIVACWRLLTHPDAPRLDMPASLPAPEPKPESRAAARESAPAAIPAPAEPAAAPASRPAPSDVAVRVVDKASADPVAGALIASVPDPLAALQAGGPIWTTDARGAASLAGPGWYAFQARGYAPRCAKIAAEESAVPREVRLSRSGRAAVRLVSAAGQVVPGITVRGWSQRSLVEEDPTLVSETRPAADVGKSADAITDSDGVARFEGLPVGKATISALTVDYGVARRETLEISVTLEESAPSEVTLLPIAVGAVVVEGLPDAWWINPVSSLTEGWDDYPNYSRDGPADSFPGQMAKIQQRQRELIGKTGCSVHLIGAIRDPRTPDPGEPVAQFKVATQSSGRGEVNGRVTLASKVVGNPVMVALKSPSAWTANDCARLRVSRDDIGAVTEVHIRFETENGDAADGCPAVLSGEGAIRFDVPKADPPGSSPISMWAPPGSYRLRPELHAPWESKAAFTFDPVSVTIGDRPVEVVARLTHPLCLVSLDVRDEFGRSLKSFVLQTRRFGAAYRKGPPTLAIDEDEWELAIAGVADAGYEGVAKHTVKLERGKLNALHYELKRKD